LEVKIVNTTKSSINIKIDADVKKHALHILARMGLDQTTAIDMFFRQVIAEHRLPFQPIPAPSLDERLIAALEGTPAKEYSLKAGDGATLLVDKDLHPNLYDWATNG
jgi:DNA-damage-inducible protein J